MNYVLYKIVEEAIILVYMLSQLMTSVMHKIMCS